VTNTDLLSRADQLRTGRTPFVLATVVRAERPTSAKPGDRALVLPDGTLEGFVGGSCAESTVRLQSMRLLATGESTLLRITPDGSAESKSDGEGTVTVANPCLSGGTLDIFLEAMLPPVLVHVYGDAPIARALLALGHSLGYEVHAASPTDLLPADLGAVVVASHGRAAEQEVLGAAIRAGVPYVGLVASTRRGAAVLAALDLSDEQRAMVHTPAGLDIGGRTAAEIALSIYAELIAVRPRSDRPPVRGEPVAAEALDPVCGMTVAITTSAMSAEVAGRTVYFCGPGCQHAFLDQPTNYPG
jgi:xanthine dehydrogenase accessory factor